MHQHIAPVWRAGGYAANAREKSIPKCGAGIVPIARIHTTPAAQFLHSKDEIRYTMSSNMLVQKRCVAELEEEEC
ncbi:hypothetical protein SBOR_1241 [Sclerotinia borealis F-4128]|uniref:Uncharacterized protein n=1 Tax=Sclerotinia borealis (strain F-4128) TaxID=1432307 RepID=W9CQP0_SCLBF|nr:hypothetical protein SBOR_1241 [Sclerotinia borealis F-4128]